MRRALRFGDGWMSGGVANDVEEIATTLRRLEAARESLRAEGIDGFEPDRPFEVTVLEPDPTAPDLQRLAELGVGRVVIMPWESNRDAPAAIERFMAMARDVVEIEAAPPLP